jgi:hypothetical protein
MALVCRNPAGIWPAMAGHGVVAEHDAFFTNNPYLSRPCAHPVSVALPVPSSVCKGNLLL